MQHIPFSYSSRNLWARKLTTFFTAGGMALVVFVFASVMMLDQGLRETLVETGSNDNVVITRRAAGTEVQSGIGREPAAIIESQPEVALGSDGERLVSKESVILISLTKRETGKPSNVIIRGVSKTGLTLRHQIKITEGRLFRPGQSEIIAGRGIAKHFTGTGLGERLRFGLREWTVVGVFDAGGSGFDSEVWGDNDQIMQAFRRQFFSSVVIKLSDSELFDALKNRLESDPRLTLDIKRERVFYADQSEALSRFITYLGITLSVIFSIGAMIGAMITMYAAVANRTSEIGTLRALGFQRTSILASFLLESILLSLLGGLVGIGLASLMQLLTISTMNWQSFAELAFSFTLNSKIILYSMVFSLLMGMVGGFLPALRAGQMTIVDALRAA